MSINSLKYHELINALTDDQKLRLISDVSCINNDEFSILGIPRIRISDLNAIGRTAYPSPKSLSRSWNPDLAKKVAAAQYKKSNLNSELVELPDAKPILSPYSTGLSEDPLLCGKLLKSYIDAAEDAQVIPLVSGLEITSDNTEYLDKIPDDRAVWEHIAKPYINAKTSNDHQLFMCSTHIENGNYHRTNQRLAEIVRTEHSFVISKNPPATLTVSEIMQGKICLGGSYNSLKDAFDNYKRLKRDNANGKCTVYELESELSQNKAISADSINIAVDRILDLAFKCKIEKNDTESDDENVFVASITESTILLKNSKNLLPLSTATATKKKICVIGGFSPDNEEDLFSSLTSKGFETNYLCGYDASKQYEKIDTDECLQSAARADVVILLLSTTPDYEASMQMHKNLNLPANRVAIISALERFNHKTVAVISSDASIDMAFTHDLPAVLLTPGNMTKSSYKVLFEILTGDLVPSGKLSSTVYFDYQNSYKELNFLRTSGIMKSGSFFGYRYYDANGYFSGFPFGHGLSYTSFSFSNLKISENSVELSVKNTGKHQGNETVQIYAHKNDSAVLRPFKVLAGFSKISLAPGESKKIKIDFTLPSVYDNENDSFEIENGSYTLYVADSVMNVVLKGTINCLGKKLPKDNVKLSSYLQSESNISSDNYKLEANCANMKRSPKNKIFILLMILASVGLYVYCGLSGIGDLFFTLVSAVLMMGAIGLVIYDVSEKIKFNKNLAQELDRINIKNFTDATQVSVLTAESIFINEFENESATPSGSTVHSNANENIEDEMAYVDASLDFISACKDLTHFSNALGCRISEETARHFLSSIASSRIVITDHLEDESFYKLISAFSKYFETDIHFQTVGDKIKCEEDMLFSENDEGVKTPTSLHHAIHSASKLHDKIFIVALNEVEFASISQYFIPYAKYAAKPLLNNTVTATNEQNTKRQYHIPPNVWFILNPKCNENIAHAPSYISEFASFARLDVQLDPVTKAAETDMTKRINYYQLKHLEEKAKRQYQISENEWKKIDKLEAYITSLTHCHFGNKLCTSVECFSSICLACGEDRANILDLCISSKILPYVLSVLNENTNNEYGDISETVNDIFGDGELPICHEILLNNIHAK